MRSQQACNISLLKHSRSQQTAGAAFKYCPGKDISKPLCEELSSQLHQPGPEQTCWCLKTTLSKYSNEKSALLTQTRVLPPITQTLNIFRGLTQGLFALCSLLSPVLHTASPLLQRRACFSSVPGLLDDVPPPNAVRCLARLCAATPDTPLGYDTGDNWRKRNKQGCVSYRKDASDMPSPEKLSTTFLISHLSHSCVGQFPVALLPANYLPRSSSHPD